MRDKPPPETDQGSLGRIAPALLLAGIGGGAAGALFLRSLDAVTRLHQQHPGLIYLLPALGVAVWWIYHRFAGAAARGTNLLIEQATADRPDVPVRLAPLILISTLLTHLGGGSAGREGTAVQMGGGIGAGVARLFGMGPGETRMVLLAGMAAGFGAVFGTPLAAAVFVIECLRPSRTVWRLLPACLVGAFVAHYTCLGLGGTHSTFNIGLPSLSRLPWHEWIHWSWVPGAAAAGLGAALVARLYIAAGQMAATGFSRIPQAWLRPVLGGCALIGLTVAIGDRSYLGLGATPLDPGGASILGAFTATPIPAWAWAVKLLFTVLTLGSGFKGGEVTPLFFMGATAGCTAAPHLGLPPALGAALGLSAVFASASRTPVACTLLGLELFGIAALPYLTIACCLSGFCPGNPTIYEAQNRNREEARQTSTPTAR